MLGNRSAGVLLLLLLASACGRGGEGAGGDGDEQSADTPVEAVFRYGPVPIGQTLAEIRNALGPPDSAAVRAVTNRHDGSVTDSVFTVHYAGLSAEVYRATFDGKELLSSVVITSDDRLRADSPLRLGMSEDELRLLLGEPTAAAGGVLSYACTSCNAAGYDFLELLLARGQLRRITLRYWIN